MGGYQSGICKPLKALFLVYVCKVKFSRTITETDYPPKANAGSDMVIHLPQNSVILYGNLSTDDKGIESYEWIKSTDDKLAADMQVKFFI